MWDRPIPSRKEAEMMISRISRLPLPMGVYSNLFLAGVGSAKIHQEPIKQLLSFSVLYPAAALEL